MWLIARCTMVGFFVISATSVAFSQRVIEFQDHFAGTNVEQALGFMQLGSRVLWPVRLDVTALFTSSTETIVQIGSENEIMFLPLALRGHPVVRGQRFLLNGKCLFSS